MIRRLSSILRLPLAYRIFIRLVGRQGPQNVFLSEYVQAVPGEKILDLGCGPADILSFLPDVDYTGIDISEEYINSAKARFGSRGRFLCNDVALPVLQHERGSFDLVLAKGVVHHLDDSQASKLFELARLALRPGGCLLTFDGCYTPEQSPIARWLLSRDRGKFVRTQAEYVRLASNFFPNIECVLRYDILRVPYTHLIMRCSNGPPRRKNEPGK